MMPTTAPTSEITVPAFCFFFHGIILQYEIYTVIVPIKQRLIGLRKGVTATIKMPAPTSKTAMIERFFFAVSFILYPPILCVNGLFYDEPLRRGHRSPRQR